MNVINLTPHTVKIVSPAGVETTYPVAPTGPARVRQLPATGLPGWWSVHITGPVEDGEIEAPCPVVQAGGWEQLEGLPESIDPGATLMVSLFCAQAAKAERQYLQEALDRGAHLDSSPVYEEDRPAMKARLAVLRRLVCPGTGPNDGPIRDSSGQVIAVTRLVRV